MPSRVVLGKVNASGNKYGVFVGRNGVNVIDGSGNLQTQPDFATHYVQNEAGGPVSINGQLMSRISSGSFTLVSGHTNWSYPNFENLLNDEYATWWTGLYTYSINISGAQNSAGTWSMPYILFSARPVTVTTDRVHGWHYNFSRLTPASAPICNMGNFTGQQNGVMWMLRHIPGQSTVTLYARGVLAHVCYWASMRPGLD